MKALTISTPILKDPSAKIAAVDQKAIPAPENDLVSRFRWTQCTIKNETQFDLKFQSSTLYSGVFFNGNPADIPQFSQGTFGAYTTNNTVFTGDSGAVAFNMKLDNVQSLDFSFSWSNPTTGPLSAGVTVSERPADAYEHSSPSGNALGMDDYFKGYDDTPQQNYAYFRVYMSAAPGLQTLFIIKQVPLIASGTYFNPGS